MDALDRKALRLLTQQARMTWAELGQALALSAPATADRVRKLEEAGVIRGYAALVDAEKVGFPLLAFVSVSLSDQRKRKIFLERVRKMEEILECHHVAGEDDYLIKVRCRSTADLNRILVDELKGKLGAARTRTTIVLESAKETFGLPVPEPPEAAA